MEYELRGGKLYPISSDRNDGTQTDIAFGEGLPDELIEQLEEAVAMAATGEIGRTEIRGIEGHTETTEVYVVSEYKKVGEAAEGVPIIEVESHLETRELPKDPEDKDKQEEPEESDPEELSDTTAPEAPAGGGMLEQPLSYPSAETSTSGTLDSIAAPVPAPPTSNSSETANPESASVAVLAPTPKPAIPIINPSENGIHQPATMNQHLAPAGEASSGSDKDRSTSQFTPAAKIGFQSLTEPSPGSPALTPDPPAAEPAGGSSHSRTKAPEIGQLVSSEVEITALSPDSPSAGDQSPAAQKTDTRNPERAILAVDGVEESSLAAPVPDRATSAVLATEISATNIARPGFQPNPVSESTITASAKAEIASAPERLSLSLGETVTIKRPMDQIEPHPIAVPDVNSTPEPNLNGSILAPVKSIAPVATESKITAPVVQSVSELPSATAVKPTVDTNSAESSQVTEAISTPSVSSAFGKRPAAAIQPSRETSIPAAEIGQTTETRQASPDVDPAEPAIAISEAVSITPESSSIQDKLPEPPITAEQPIRESLVPTEPILADESDPVGRPKPVRVAAPTVPVTRESWLNDFTAAPATHTDDSWRTAIDTPGPTAAERLTQTNQTASLNLTAAPEDGDLEITVEPSVTPGYRRPARRTRTAAA